MCTLVCRVHSGLPQCTQGGPGCTRLRALGSMMALRPAELWKERPGLSTLLDRDIKIGEDVSLGCCDKLTHKLVAQNNRSVFPTSCGGQKCEAEVSAAPGSLRRP